MVGGSDSFAREMEWHICVYHGGEINESHHCACVLTSGDIKPNIVMLGQRHTPGT
jgi:hypothetical protein